MEIFLNPREYDGKCIVGIQPKKIAIDDAVSASAWDLGCLLAWKHLHLLLRRSKKSSSSPRYSKNSSAACPDGAYLVF